MDTDINTYTHARIEDESIYKYLGIRGNFNEYKLK